MATQKPIISVVLERDLYEKICNAAKRSGLSKSAMVRLVLLREFRERVVPAPGSYDPVRGEIIR